MLLRWRMLARGKRGDFYPEQEEEVEEKRSRPRNKLIPTEVVLPKKDLPVKSSEKITWGK